MIEASTILTSYNLKIVLLLTVGFGLAAFLGYIAIRLKISPILGYLLAGYVIGPYFPGFVADIQISEQLAEMGVVLMMFGVGLNFKLNDLLRVGKIAIPGAIGQTVLCALLSAFALHLFGWPFHTGIFLGLAVGVSSTVVLFRMLGEANLLKTREGHVAASWLIVEDVITVVILLLLPTLATLSQGLEFSAYDLWSPVLNILVKFLILLLVLWAFSQRVVSYIFSKVIKTHSEELFTLTVLALIFFIATATTFFFGMSIALGAFIAGMVIRQTKEHHKAFMHSLPMKDAFIVIFFLSAGMLFNPLVIVNHFASFITILLIILLVKPALAFLISCILRCPFKTALTVAIALAQIGEFSFILAEEATRFGILPDEAYDMIVASALISIALNPLMFKLLTKKGAHPKAYS